MQRCIKGLTSVAAPVLGHDGVARPAISLVGPTNTMLGYIYHPARLVQLPARKLSAQLVPVIRRLRTAPEAGQST